MKQTVLRRKSVLAILIIAVVVLGGVLYAFWGARKPSRTHEASQDLIPLPEPTREGGITVEKAIAQRRSVRDFTGESLSLGEVSLILWSGQGITEPGLGLRAAPSAGATYPITLYLVVGEGGVEGLGAGVYGYAPESHALRRAVTGDVREALQDAALGQWWVGAAPVTVVIAADYKRTTQRYGERGARYVDNEVGCVAENIYLEVESLRLGTVLVGAFDDERVQAALSLRAEMEPRGLMPIGHVKR